MLISGPLKKTIRKILIVFIILYSLLGASCFEESLQSARFVRKRMMSSPVFSSRKTFSTFFQNILTPGLRGVFTDLLLIQIHDLWNQERWYKIPEYFEAVTILQPEWLDGWELGSWHMAYNVSYEIEDSPLISPANKQKEVAWWIDRGLNMLKSGIIINDDTYHLYFQTGWIYYHRLKDYDKAIIYFRRAMKFADCIDNVPRLIAYSYKKKGDAKKALEILENLQADESYHKNDQGTLSILRGQIAELKKEFSEP